MAAHWEGPPLEAWRAWTPDEAVAVLAGCPVDWCVVGGWAVDLAVGRQTRDHGDLEIAIVRPDFLAIRNHLEAKGFVIYEAGDGETRRLAPGHAPGPDKNQTWVADAALGVWRLDVMLEAGDAQIWVCRRDERLRAPREFMIAGGPVPHLKPHGGLIYKAKYGRPKDEADFAQAAPLLSKEERAWLIEALGALHPGHPWIAALEGR